MKLIIQGKLSVKYCLLIDQMYIYPMFCMFWELIVLINPIFILIMEFSFLKRAILNETLKFIVEARAYKRKFSKHNLRYIYIYAYLGTQGVYLERYQPHVAVVTWWPLAYIVLPFIEIWNITTEPCTSCPGKYLRINKLLKDYVNINIWQYLLFWFYS